MAPIVTGIRNAMATAIDTMTTDSFNLNWGNSNEYDRAKIDWSKYDASAMIELLSEDNDDFDGGAHGCAYRNRVDIRIRVRVPLAAESLNAEYDIVERMMLANDDLKQCFKTQNISDHYIQYDRWEIEASETGDAYMPQRMFWFCHVWYIQDRDDPEQVGD